MRSKCFGLVLAATLFAGMSHAGIAITHVDIVDVANGSLQRDLTVIITDGRVERIGPSATLQASASDRIVEGRGKYLVPGFWDMHVHTVSHDLDFPLEVANGITGVRDTGGSNEVPPPGNWGVAFDVLRTWRAQIQAGTLIGPRIVAAGAALDGPDAFWPQTISIKSPAEARSVVGSLKRDGVDFIKVYVLLPKNVLLAIAEEAKKQGLTFAGHTSQFVPVAEAAAAGQRSFEHIDAFEPTYYDPATLRSFLLRLRGPTSQEERADLMSKVQATYDLRRLEAAARALKAHGARLDPTLVTWRSLACTPDGPAAHAERAAYVPRHVRSIWQARMQSRCSPRIDALHAKRWEHQLAALRLVRRYGVEILVGADAWNPYVVPGFSLHDEMAMLVDNGMTTAEVLRAATLGAAEFLQMEDALGTVAPGKLADLVLLEANPLEDIRNTRRVNAVVLNGRFLDRKELDRLLETARSSAGR
ncbi:MAG: amidohydrolase family protein [Gammaproteobacteria bacterium]